MNPRRMKRVWDVVAKTLATSFQTAPAQTACLALAVLLCAALPVAAAWVGKLIIDGVVETRHAVGDPQRDSALKMVGIWVLAELALVACLSLSERVAGVARTLVGRRLQTHLTESVLKRSIALDFDEIEQAESTGAISGALDAAASLPGKLVKEVFTAVGAVVMFCAYGAALAHFSWWAVGGLFVGALPAIAHGFAREKPEAEDSLKARDEKREISHVESILSTVKFAKETRVFGSSPWLLEKYRLLTENQTRRQTSHVLRSAGWSFFLSAISLLAFYACYIAVARASALGECSIGEMSLYLIAVRRGKRALDSAADEAREMVDASAPLDRLYGFINSPAHRKAGTAKVPGSEERGIRFDDVSFKYPGTERFVLQHLSFFIPPGRCVAVVGENGSGKTTMMKLLLGFYRPTSGRILVDGCDVEEWDRSTLRRRFSALFQDYNKYQLSFRENIAMANLEFVENDARVWSAAKDGGADFIRAKLHSGLDTPMGRASKDGLQLSGGQWQRVAIGRAFFREDADIMILDEPTAALDPAAQEAMFDRFRSLYRGRASIVITHRFATARTADIIMVMEQGRLAESGSHDELVKKSGSYGKLFAIQARAYA